VIARSCSIASLFFLENLPVSGKNSGRRGSHETGTRRAPGAQLIIKHLTGSAGEARGAGKSTTIKMLTTSLRPTSGTILVDGHDPTRKPHAVRRAFGILFRDPSLDEDLTAWENMELHGVLYGVLRGTGHARIDEMLKFVELDDRRHSYVREFSGGMKRMIAAMPIKWPASFRSGTMVNSMEIIAPFPTLLYQQYGAKLLQPSLGRALPPRQAPLRGVRDGCKCGHIGGRPAQVLAEASFLAPWKHPGVFGALIKINGM